MVEAWVLLAALVLDRVFADPRRFHPVVMLGWCAQHLERWLNRGSWSGLGGLLAVVLLSAMVMGMAAWLRPSGTPGWWFDALILFLAVAPCGLRRHAMDVAQALKTGEPGLYRRRVAMMVSRDCDQMDRRQAVDATVESVLENGSDAVFAPIFWYLVAGVQGLVLYRVVNTLDAMWGYRTKRYRRFGFTAAKLDDWLNWVPARLTVFTYLLLARFPICWRQFWTQSRQWQSPNAGPVICAGAWALGMRLGGPASYHGRIRIRPTLGPQMEGAGSNRIEAAVALVEKGVLLWLAVVFLGAAVA